MQKLSLKMYDESHSEPRGSISPTCSLSFFDCMPAPRTNLAHKRASEHIGVEREMRIMYQQPHLVPPMKLTVYDELPPTPGLPAPSTISQLVTQGRNLASRASSRASAHPRRKLQKPSISRPQPLQEDGTPRRAPRRLELSIYLPSNRLSDLPEFDNVPFTEDGAIQLPLRALIRARSEEALGTISPPQSARKTSSMYQERVGTMHTRQNTTSSIISTSRPPSEYDALHSHPVSMISMPGMPPHIFHQPNTVLSPIQDEFTPQASSALMDGIVNEFPTIDNKVREKSASLPPQQPIPTAAPPPVPNAAPLRFRFKSRTYSNSTSHSKSTTHSQAHISNWVNHSQTSSVSSSYSTITTMTSASMSFSEHRRKKSQFYQCQPYHPEQSQAQPQVTFNPPKALALRTHNRHRTLSASTVASVDTIDTNIMLLEDDRSDGQSSTTTADAPVVHDMRTRSFSKPIALVKETEMAMPLTQVDIEALAEGMMVKELNGGVIRSPGVGVAF